MIVNGSYFVGELHLSQVAPENTSRVTNNKVKNAYFIDEYELEILDNALGYGLRQEFYSHLDPQNGCIKEEYKDSKWDHLLNGKEYKINNCDFYWPGLVITNGLAPRSLMAYYIYFMYMTNDVTKHTASGNTNGKKGKVRAASTIPKTTRAWNKMIKWYGDYRTISEPIVQRYGNVTYTDWLGGQDNSGKVSLYQFMSHHKDEFSNWRFTPLERINRFEI